MVVRRFSIAEVVPVYVCLSPSCFWLCPTSAPTRNPLSAVTRRFLLSSKSEIPAPNHCSVTRLFAPQRATQEAEDRERERERKLKP